MTAEQRVHDVLRAALPAEYRLYPNVRWILKWSAQAPARDGETDLVIVHPEQGLLIVETKGGRIRRDGQGRWWSGEHAIDPPPFKQSEDSKHAIAAYLTSLPDWPGRPGSSGVDTQSPFPMSRSTAPTRRPWVRTHRARSCSPKRTSPRRVTCGRRSRGRTGTGSGTDDAVGR